VPDALVLPPGSLLPKSVLASGRVEIQDAGSQLVAPLLDALPGERIIDSCAGAGGKTLHLAAMMKNFGRIDALDVSPDKLKELKRRASRAGADIIDAALWGTSKLTNSQNSADRLLVDAPCSGLGTLRRQPDIKWRLSMQKLDQLHQTQRQILQEQQAMVKPGGRLVYATCSILPSENRRSIDPLLDTGHFQLLSEHQISPAETGFDGFYAAVLLKNQV
jgi:16S rRNA (cytosine967-C5)-methyltransferase